MKQKINALVISNEKIAPSHYVMEIEAPALSSNSSPGQFVMVKVEERTYDPLLRIPLGIHSIKKENIKLLYKVVGKGTEILSAKAKDEKLDIIGPLGKGFSLDFCEASSPRKRGSIKMDSRFHGNDNQKNARAILVSGGHGIAPLFALAETLIKRKNKIDFFIGACAKKHIVCTKELKKLGANVHIATEDGSLGYKGYITDLVRKYLHQPRNTQYALRTTIYACGPHPMLAQLALMAKKYKIQAEVSLDAYMACGIGACLGCATSAVDGGYKLVCKDGPVFDINEIDWGRN